MSETTVAQATTQTQSQSNEPAYNPADNKATSFQSNNEAMPLEIYSQEKRQDYAIEALDINEDMETLPYSMKNKITNISKYIQSQINENGLEATTESYKQVLKSLKKQLGITQNTLQDVTIDKLYGYIDALKTLKSLKEIDDPIFLKSLAKAANSKEINDLLMTKIEKYIK